MLIVPRRPMLSLRELYSEEWDELNNFSRQIASALEVFPGAPYLFEHGNTVLGGPVGCGVDQAHLHLVPLAFDLFDAIAVSADSNLEWTDHAEVANFASAIPDVGEYVAVWRPRDGRGLGGKMREPRSQWIRRVIAEKLGRGHLWDYKAHPEVQNLLETVKAMDTAFPQKFLSLLSN